MIGLIGLKILILIGLFLFTLLCTGVPIILAKGKLREEIHDEVGLHRKRILSALTCFGGGVFLATCFLHLLTESQEQIADGLKDAGIDTKFPLSTFVVIVGFLVVLILEQTILHFKEDSGEDLLHGHGHDSQAYGTIQENAGYSENEEDTRFETVSTHEDPSSHSSLRAIILVFALSLHSVFEGLAIGLQRDASGILQLFGAVCIHKGVIALTLSLNLLATRELKLTTIVICNLVFSLMAPTGMVISIIIEKSLSSLTNGILQGFACGTFVYITFMEVLPHELNGHHLTTGRLGKMFCLLLGVSLVVTLLLIFPDA